MALSAFHAFRILRALGCAIAFTLSASAFAGPADGDKKWPPIEGCIRSRLPVITTMDNDGITQTLELKDLTDIREAPQPLQRAMATQALEGLASKRLIDDRTGIHFIGWDFPPDTIDAEIARRMAISYVATPPSRPKVLDAIGEEIQVTLARWKAEFGKPALFKSDVPRAIKSIERALAPSRRFNLDVLSIEDLEILREAKVRLAIFRGRGQARKVNGEARSLDPSKLKSTLIEIDPHFDLELRTNQRAADFVPRRKSKVPEQASLEPGHPNSHTIGNPASLDETVVPTRHFATPDGFTYDRGRPHAPPPTIPYVVVRVPASSTSPNDWVLQFLEPGGSQPLCLAKAAAPLFM